MIVALAGACTSASLTPPRLISKTATPLTAHSSPDPHLLAARLDAAQLLNLVPVSPGAEPSPTAPSPVVSHPPTEPATPYLVDQATWWTAPGTMDSVIAWVQAHAPPGTTMGGSGFASDHGVVQWRATGWMFPPQPRVLTSRQLSVMVAPNGPAVAIRADAQVIWDPVRAPSSLIPDSQVTSITVTQLPSEPWSPTTSTTLSPAVTLTEQSSVDRYVEIVNSLPVDDGGVRSCPAWTGFKFQVTFKGAGGSVVATLTGDEAQCGGYGLTVGGQSQKALSDPDRQLLRLVSSTLGIPLSS